MKYMAERNLITVKKCKKILLALSAMMNIYLFL